MTQKFKRCLFISALSLVGFFVPRLQGQDDAALTDSLKKKILLAKTDSDKVKLMDALSYAYSRINPSEGIKYGLLSESLAKKINWKKGMATAGVDLGMNYANKCVYDTAIAYYLKSMAIYKELGNKPGMGSIFANLALVYLARSDYPGALNNNFKALFVFEELNDVLKKAIVQENIGSVYLEQKNYPRTSEYYALALENYKLVNNKPGVARNLGNQGIVLNEMGNYAKALEYHLLALKTNEELGNESSIQINLANIAITYGYLKNYPLMLSYHQQALALSRKLQDPRSIAISLGNTGEAYYFMASDARMADKAQNLKQSIALLNEAVSLCKEIAFKGPQIEFCRYLSSAYELSGDYRKAFSLYKECSLEEDSLFSEESKLKISSLESKRTLDLKNKDIVLQDQQLQIGQLQTLNKRRERIIFMFGIGLLLAVVIFLYWRFKKAMEQQAIIKQYAQQVEAVNKELEAFSYSISHDLRAPLRAIDGYTRILEEDFNPLFDDEGKRVLAAVQHNTKKMGTLIGDLLAFAKLGKKEVTKADMDMELLMNEAWMELKETLEHKAEMRIGSLHRVKGDLAMIRQVIINLLSNAIKYSSKKEKPLIEITSELSNTEVIYTVKDNGEGFDMKYSNKLFGVFQRLHSEKEFEGTGVGLAMVSRIINKHGGTVRAEAEPGKGAAFSFSLPL
jgi:signal transduction histidine kinase/tetratricopeptide (TPR) repeat protein